jgi:putative ABC transport system permease protein
LLQPKAPKAGKRVLLERIEPIWSRLNFNHKVTYRNLFRYKARMILTILGIAGCTGLMVAGFGLNDSIGAPADLQFNKLTHYQAIVTLNDKVAATQAKKVAAVLTDNQKVTRDLPVYSEQVNFKKADAAKQTASLFVTDNAQKFDDYVTFSKVAGDATATLTNSGAIISQQLAKIFDVAAGDTLTMQDTAGHQYKLKIAAVVKNYLGHNVYMTKDYYQKLTDQTPVFNSFVVQSQKMTTNEETALSKKLMDTGNVLNTTYMSATIKTQESATENMGAIVLIFIILSGTLAFVVLYNLTNINISERERELATIKVLGLYDKEVTMYIVRENIIFTIFGILFGFAIGNLLTWFIITTVTMDLMVFPLVINWQGYVVSAVMTAVFSGIVSLVTHRKLKRIHMIEALKSNE